MIITRHAMRRMKERCGGGESLKKLFRRAAIAYSRGTGRDEAKGALRRYMDENFTFHGCGRDMKVHGGLVWVFEGEALVTVKPIPCQLKHKWRVMKHDEEG